MKEEDGIFFSRTSGRLSRDTTRHQHSLSSAKGAMIYQRRLQFKRRKGKTKYNSDERKCHRQRCALYIRRIYFTPAQSYACNSIILFAFQVNNRVIEQIKQKLSWGNPGRVMKNRVTSSSHPECENLAYYLWYLSSVIGISFLSWIFQIWKIQMIRADSWRTTRIIFKMLILLSRAIWWREYKAMVFRSIVFRSRALLRAISRWGLMIHFHDILCLVLWLHENNLAPF